MQRQQINIRIPKELKEEFYQYCKKEQLNPSALIRSWIEEAVEKNKRKSNKFNSKFLLPRNMI